MRDIWDEMQKDAVKAFDDEEAEALGAPKDYYTRAEVDELIRNAVKEALRPEEAEEEEAPEEEQKEAEHEEGTEE